jgi:hypothetical protein
MSGRYFLLIPALLVDGLQALLSLGLAGVFTTLGGTLSMVPVVGTVVAAGVMPTGIVMGFALNFVISATFGVALITFLTTGGVFYPRYLVSGGGELLPGLNNLPFWTLFALLCILHKNREERETHTENSREQYYPAQPAEESPAEPERARRPLQDIRPASSHA